MYMPFAGDVEVDRGYYYSVGIHPWELTEHNAGQLLDYLKQQLRKKQFVAVGEAGLDKLAVASMELQLTVFKAQVRLSEEYGLPFDYPLRESNGRAVSSEKRISSPTSLDMAWFPWKNGAGGAVAKEGLLSFFGRVLF